MTVRPPAVTRRPSPVAITTSSSESRTATGAGCRRIQQVLPRAAASQSARLLRFGTFNVSSTVSIEADSRGALRPLRNPVCARGVAVVQHLTGGPSCAPTPTTAASSLADGLPLLLFLAISFRSGRCNRRKGRRQRGTCSRLIRSLSFRDMAGGVEAGRAGRSGTAARVSSLPTNALAGQHRRDHGQRIVLELLLRSPRRCPAGRLPRCGSPGRAGRPAPERSNGSGGGSASLLQLVAVTALRLQRVFPQACLDHRLRQLELLADHPIGAGNRTRAAPEKQLDKNTAATAAPATGNDVTRSFAIGPPTMATPAEVRSPGLRKVGPASSIAQPTDMV